MSSLPAAQPLRLSYEDYCAVPTDGRRYQLIEGELFVGPAPTSRHQRISRNLEFILHGHVSARGLGEVFDAPIDVILDRETVVQPDLLFVSSARAAIISERGVEAAPDLVVEILSPSTEALDRGPKRQLYARYGVVHYWIVDPEARSLTEYVLQSGQYALRATHPAAQTCTTAVFPDLSINLPVVFG
jgi:Uma2 family endonuclease